MVLLTKCFAAGERDPAEAQVTGGVLNVLSQFPVWMGKSVDEQRLSSGNPLCLLACDNLC